MKILRTLEKEIEEKKSNLIAKVSSGAYEVLSRRCADYSNMSKEAIKQLVSDTTNTAMSMDDSFPESGN